MAKNNELLVDHLSNELESLYRETDLQVLGSVARHAILSSYGEETGPLLAFRSNGELRDLDVVSHVGGVEAVPKHLSESPYIDLKPSYWIQGGSDEVWITFPGDASIAESLRPEVFAPVTRSLAGIACRTYSATTQRNLDHMSSEQFKNWRKFREYDKFLASLGDRPDVLDGDVPLPEEFYAPFKKFRHAIDEKYPEYYWISQAAGVVGYLPPSFKPVAKKIGAPLTRRYRRKQ